MKYCSGCKQNLPFNEFGKNSCKGDNLSPYCKSCTKRHQQEVKALKKSHPKPKHCECCGKLTDGLLIDHCHETGKYRGWICRKCNTGIGMLGDNLDGIKLAKNYLMRTIMTEYQPTPQTPEQVDEGLRNAMKQAKEDGVFDLDKLLDKHFKRPPSLWKIMRDELGFSIDMCDEIVDAVERWLPKEDPRPSYDTLQWDKCVRMMREKLWEQTE